MWSTLELTSKDNDVLKKTIVAQETNKQDDLKVKRLQCEETTGWEKMFLYIDQIHRGSVSKTVKKVIIKKRNKLI